MKLLTLLMLLIPVVGFSQVSVKAMFQNINAAGFSVGHYSKTNDWSSYGVELGFHQNEYSILNLAFIPRAEKWNFNIHSGVKFGILIGEDENNFETLIGGGYTLNLLEIGYRHNFMLAKVNGEYPNYHQVYLGLNL